MGGLTARSPTPSLYVFVLAPLINGLGHWRGAQNFPNTAYNLRILAWVTGGESLHNNHHAHPRAPKFSVRRLEFDPSWPVIRFSPRSGWWRSSGDPSGSMRRTTRHNEGPPRRQALDESKAQEGAGSRSPTPGEVSGDDRLVLTGAYKAGLILAWKRDTERGYCLTLAGRADEYVDVDKLGHYLAKLKAAA